MLNLKKRLVGREGFFFLVPDLGERVIFVG